ncbi:glycosyltransferase family A protein [Streptococcus merionis]|uniref:glycosyltransferase family 2 protein n=1 Tax=Streptococcus merionis TaxID=400065 RepID=UPI0026F00F3B|nr:glycosyltransferase family A protein [Streptococcus merionis]
MDNLVSVVVTCFNHENFIEDCLKSVFNQTYSNIELIVIDDGSTDNSGKMIQGLLNESPFQRSEYIYQENAGLVNARNKGLSLISGDFVIFLDSDDALDLFYVEETLKIAVSADADIVYTKMINLETQEIVLEAKDFSLGQLYYENFIHAASLIRVAKIGNTKYDTFLNYKKLEDYDFFLTLIAEKGAKAVPCFTTHLSYRVLENSMSDRENMSKHYDTYSYILSKNFAYHPKEAESALNKHFHSLDINHSIRQEKMIISIVIGEAETFIQEKPIRFKDTFEVTLKNLQSGSIVRVRPSNIPSFYQYIKVTNRDTMEVISPILSNGTIIDNSFVFKDFYPFIDYPINEIDALDLVIEYQRFNISDITASDYIAKILAENSLVKDGIIRENEVRNNDLSNQLQISQQKLYSLQEEYNSIITSRRWTIPTKIINFFRRTK